MSKHWRLAREQTVMALKADWCRLVRGHRFVEAFPLNLSGDRRSFQTCERCPERRVVRS